MDKDEPQPPAEALIYLGVIGLIKGAGIMVLPVLLGWIQFELFWEKIYVIPLVGLIGEIWMSISAAGILSSERWQWIMMMVFLAIVFLPLSILTASLLIDHFREHGSTVTTSFWGNGYQRHQFSFDSKLPDAPQREIPELGSGTRELIAALASAKTVNTKIIALEGRTYEVLVRRGLKGALKKLMEFFETHGARAHPRRDRKEGVATAAPSLRFLKILRMRNC
ncbi:MAG: hypothetical protein MK135_11955 [Polyangiaceae bacterium]|nr:hypothetical protein [Polyangiaceae bacterium]